MESLPYPLMFEEFNQHACASSPMDESKYFTQELSEDLMHLVFEDVNQGQYNQNGTVFNDDFYLLGNNILDSVDGFVDGLDVYHQQELNSGDDYLDLLANADEYIGEELNLVNTSLDNLNLSLLFDENQPNMFLSDVNSVVLDNEPKSPMKISSPGIEATDEFGLLDKFEKEIQIPITSSEEFIDVCKIDDETVKYKQNSLEINETSLNNVDVKVESLSEPASVKLEESSDSKVNTTKTLNIKKVKSENDMKCKMELNRKKHNIKPEDIAETELKKALAKLTSEEKIRQMKEKAKALSKAIQQQLVNKTKNLANSSPINDHMQDHSYATNSENIHKNDSKDINNKISNDVIINSNSHDIKNTKETKCLEKLTDSKINTNMSSSNNISNGFEHPPRHAIFGKSEINLSKIPKHAPLKQENISPTKDITKSNRPSQQTAQVIVCSSANKPQKRMTSILKFSKFNLTPKKINNNELDTTCYMKLNEQNPSRSDSSNDNCKEKNYNCKEKKPMVRTFEMNSSKSYAIHQTVDQSNSEPCPFPDMMYEVVINSEGVTLANESSALSTKVKKKLSLSEYKLLLPKRRYGDISKPKSPFDTDQVIEYDYCYTSDHSYHKGFDMTAKEINGEGKPMGTKFSHKEEERKIKSRNNYKKLNVDVHAPSGTIKNKDDLKHPAVSFEHYTSDNDNNVKIQTNANETMRETTLVSQFVADLQRRRKLKDERRINVYNSKRRRVDQSPENETNGKVTIIVKKNLRNADYTLSDSTSDCELIQRPNHRHFKGTKNRHESRSQSRSRSRSLDRLNNKTSCRAKFRSRYLPTKRPSYESRSRSRSRSRSSSYSSSSSRSRSRSRSRSPARGGSRFNMGSKARDNSKSKHDRTIAMEERRVVYINHLPSHFTKAHLERKMGYFGSIVESSVHFRDNRDCFGFVTYETSLHAAQAIQDGHKVPGCETFQFCYGGRREFCGSNYSDLDHEAVRYSYRRPPTKPDTSSDYQNLLMETLEHIKSSKRCQWDDDS